MIEAQEGRENERPEVDLKAYLSKQKAAGKLVVMLCVEDTPEVTQKVLKAMSDLSSTSSPQEEDVLSTSTDDIEALVDLAAESEVMATAYRAAVEFTIDETQGLDDYDRLRFLEMWAHGDFKEIQRDFPEFDISTIGEENLKLAGITLEK
jgi:hypothetical protein